MLFIIDLQKYSVHPIYLSLSKFSCR